MPTKYAVQTNILSKKWRCNWTFVHNLDFDNCFLEDVHRMLKLYKNKTSKVELFRLIFSKWSVKKSILSMWIDDAVMLNVSELDLEVKIVEFPASLFTCKTLTKFRLHFCPGFKSRYKALWNCPSLVSLPCLKTLDIVVYSKPFNNAFKLINGCPVLENLSLKIQQRVSAEDYYFEISTLKRLTLSLLRSISVNNTVVLNVPNLKYLCLNMTNLNSRFMMKDLSSLVEAKVSCGVNNYHLWVELIKGISGTKYLSSTIELIKFLFSPRSNFKLF